MFAPEIVQDWLDWSERLKVLPLVTKQEVNDFVSAMPEDLIQELGGFYVRAAEPENLEAVREWLLEIRSVPMEPEERAIRNLFRVFSRLGHEAWKPFYSRLIGLGELGQELPDWSKLPEEIRSIAPAAEAAAEIPYIFSDEVRESLKDELDEWQIAMYTEAAEICRAYGWNRIDQWRRREDIEPFVESRMVFSLTGVLDALGLDFGTM